MARDLIELFAVAPGEDDAFLAAFESEAAPGVTLHRALRPDVRLRYASLEGGPRDGVLLIVPFDVPEGEDFAAAWEPVAAAFAKRQGHLSTRVLPGPVAVVHWSSPLMYARAVRADGDLIAALPYPSEPALYVSLRSADRP